MTAQIPFPFSLNKLESLTSGSTPPSSFENLVYFYFINPLLNLNISVISATSHQKLLRLGFFVIFRFWCMRCAHIFHNVVEFKKLLEGRGKGI